VDIYGFSGDMGGKYFAKAMKAGPARGRTFPTQPDCLLIVYLCSRTHSSHPPSRPRTASPYQLNLHSLL